MTRHAPLLLLCLAAFSPAWAKPQATPRMEPEPTAAWRTEEGKHDAWRDLARWYVDNDMPGEALDMVARLISVGEATPEIRLVQGRALLAQGIPDEAQIVLEQVAKEMPRDPRPYRELGLLYADRGETEMAITMLERSVSLDGADPVSRNNLGFLMLALDRCTEAAEQIERAVELDPANARYRNNLGFALVCAGDGKRALQLFRTTGSEAEARFHMGVAYERLDKTPSAVLQYQQVLELAPDHAGALDALTRLSVPSTPSPGVP